jgi:hypothetical protein
VPFNSSPSWFFWTFVNVVYSEAKLKISGDKTSHFGPFWTGNASDICLLMCTLTVSFIHQVLISIFLWVYQFSENVQSCYIFKSINSWCTVPLYSVLSLVSDKFGIFDRSRPVVSKATLMIPSLHMTLTLRDEYWIKFCMRLVTWYSCMPLMSNLCLTRLPGAAHKWIPLLKY